MNVNDLNYLLKSIENEERNIYRNISIGSNSSHINFLKKSEIEYTINDISTSEKEFSIYSKTGEEISTFVFPYYPYTTKTASNLIKNKSKLEKHFHNYGFNTTYSKVYNFDECQKAKMDIIKSNIKQNIVIKPLNSSLGKGVFVNVPIDRFSDNWQYSKDDLSVSEKRKQENLKVIVQNYIPGFEARATILQGNLISIIARIPPYVIGDGKSSIRELINRKNNDRKKCRYLAEHPIKITKKITEFLVASNISLNHIPAYNESILLNSVSNIVGGGEIIDITDKISHHIKEFALDVLASILGIYSGGLDLMLSSYHDENPYILEVNTYPVISLTKYPTYGKPKNPSKILFESLISQYQVGRKDENCYEIVDSDFYIKNFIDFSIRSLKFIN